ELGERRTALARLEARQRLRSERLGEAAMFEADRALALGEEARDLGELIGTLEEQAALREELAALPGPRPRPGSSATAPSRSSGTRSVPQARGYRLPVRGRLVTGLGEISQAGVRSRGLLFETRPGAQVVAPRAGRIAYADAFRGYGDIVIIDHGGGWTTLITGLATLSVAAGEEVATGSPLGRAGAGAGTQPPRIGVELRRKGRPYPVSRVVAGR
ncbi:MAG: murein hydrolase activator EnvC family protein, partial [Sphingomonadaceae bacterium]